MQALVPNGWVVPNEDGRSMFFTRMISNGGPMDGVFSDDEKEIIRAWIASGAQMPPSVTARDKEAPAMADAVAKIAVKQRIPRRHLIGMGAVH